MVIVRKNIDIRTVVQQSVPGLVALGMALPAFGQAVEFNDAFLKKGGGPVELKYFERGSALPPGRYEVDVHLNGSLVKRQYIAFAADESGQVKAVIELGLLKSLGVNVARLTKEERIPIGSDDGLPVDVPGLVPGAAAEFEVNTLSLMISMPQAYVVRNARGSVDPSLWDDGATAVFADYQVNLSHNRNSGYNSDYQFVGLRSGLNIGGWRVRNDSTITSSTGSSARFSSNRTFVEHDVRSLRGRAAAGELYSSGEIFDSVRFVGGQIQSELGMLPENELGFAPVVRGIAESNAIVEVRQNGYVIYSMAVPPGAFEITDIYPSGSNGDLQVTITEADGRVRRFTQPYSYLPVMIRRGSMRYSLSGGQYSGTGQARPKFVQGTLVYGVSDDFTGYGGLIAAQNYGAVNLGMGLNTRLGGLSLDVTHSQSRTPLGTKQGQSARFLYSKTLNATNTSFTMVGYRYSTDGYRTLAQHVEDLGRAGQDSYGAGYGSGYAGYARQKSRIDLNINQSLSRGSLFASYGEASYWNREGRTRRLQFGYSGSISFFTYNLAVSRTQGDYGGNDTQFTASISIPLGKAGTSHRAYASVVSSDRGDANVQTGVSGTLDERNTVNYSVQGGYNERGGGSGGASLNWNAPLARVTGNYSQSRSGMHVDAGLSGSVVVHSGGVTLGQPLGETFAVVEVPEVAGAGFDGGAWGVRTDRRGYAVMPSLQPYRQNWLNIDPSTIGSDTEVADSSKLLVPTRGAIVKARFTAEQGRRVQFELSTGPGADGKLPFGAQAYDEDGKLVGMVDNQSRLLVFGIKEQGRIDVRWGNDSCAVSYWLQPKNNDLAYDRVAQACRPQPAQQKS